MNVFVYKDIHATNYSADRMTLGKGRTRGKGGSKVDGGQRPKRHSSIK